MTQNREPQVDVRGALEKGTHAPLRVEQLADLVFQPQKIPRAPNRDGIVFGHRTNML
jgi:hypothetical protein